MEHVSTGSWNTRTVQQRANHRELWRIPTCCRIYGFLSVGTNNAVHTSEREFSSLSAISLTYVCSGCPENFLSFLLVLWIQWSRNCRATTCRLTLEQKFEIGKKRNVSYACYKLRILDTLSKIVKSFRSPVFGKRGSNNFNERELAVPVFWC